MNTITIICGFGLAVSVLTLFIVCWFYKEIKDELRNLRGDQKILTTKVQNLEKAQDRKERARAGSNGAEVKLEQIQSVLSSLRPGGER